MRAHGIERLSLLHGLCGNPVGVNAGLAAFTGAERIARFFRLFPDQSEWVRKLAAEVKAERVQELFARIRYVDPPELFTMYACLYLCSPVVHNAKVFASSAQRCPALVAEYTREHGQPPHPVVLLGLATGNL